MSRQVFPSDHPFKAELRPSFEPEVQRAILARLTSSAAPRSPRSFGTPGYDLVSKGPHDGTAPA